MFRTGICHELLDLLIYVAQNTSTSTSTTHSPSTPSSPPRTPHQRSSHLPLTQQQKQSSFVPDAPPYKHDFLLRLKIKLRDEEWPEKSRTQLTENNKKHAWVDPIIEEGETGRLGKNEGTVRFVFGPERLVHPRQPLNYEPDPNPEEDAKYKASAEARDERKKINRQRLKERMKAEEAGLRG